jgi:hypothetical protein
MRKACLGRPRASRAHCFRLCFLFKEQRKWKRRSTLMTPLIGQPLNIRGAYNGEAQAEKLSPRGAARGGVAVLRRAVLSAGASGTHARTHALHCLCKEQPRSSRSRQQPKPLTSVARARGRCGHVSSGMGSAARGCDAAGRLASSHPAELVPHLRSLLRRPPAAPTDVWRRSGWVARLRHCAAWPYRAA